MSTAPPRILPRRRPFKAMLDATVGFIAVSLLSALRWTNRQRLANLLGRLMRWAGPWLPEHRIGRANLAAAFPDKSPAEIDAILAGVWDNLGRVAAEFAHLDRLKVLDLEHGDDGSADVFYDRVTNDRFVAVREQGQPTLIFAAHLANWEIPALAAAAHGLHSNILYRRPNIKAVNDAVLQMRAGCMGTLVPAGLDAPVRLADALERGEHVGMLVDQHHVRGVDVVFFGRWVKANPLIAQLARLTGCPIRGVRIVRLPDGNRFRGELTEPLTLPRTADGKVDLQGTMQAITSMIEGWVREHPEQWLWLHRRWR